jgi:hypothetical protein
MFSRSRLARHFSATRPAAVAALGLLCSSACVDTEPEDVDAIELSALDCAEPLPLRFITEMGGSTEPAPSLPDATVAASRDSDLTSLEGHGLLTIDPQLNPYKVRVPEHCVPLGQEYVAIVNICVDTAGEVSSVTSLQSTLPIIDSQLPYVIGRWRYNPYLVAGTATPFCYNLRYRVR